MFDPKRNIAENDTSLVLHFIKLILPPIADRKKALNILAPLLVEHFTVLARLKQIGTAIKKFGEQDIHSLMILVKESERFDLGFETHLEVAQTFKVFQT